MTITITKYTVYFRHMYSDRHQQKYTAEHNAKVFLLETVTMHVTEISRMICDCYCHCQIKGFITIQILIYRHGKAVWSSKLPITQNWFPKVKSFTRLITHGCNTSDHLWWVLDYHRKRSTLRKRI